MAALQLQVVDAEESCPSPRVETRAKSCQALPAFAAGQETAMDWDDLAPKPKKGVTLGEDLKTLSVAELEARIGELQREIERVNGELGAKKAHEAAAAQIFKR
jgi:uncharacterized small protein (DUF1192 family)